MIYNYDIIMNKVLIYLCLNVHCCALLLSFVYANGYISLAQGSLMLIYPHYNVFGYLQKRQFVSLFIRLCACNSQMASREKATNNIFSIILTSAVRFSLMSCIQNYRSLFQHQYGSQRHSGLLLVQKLFSQAIVYYYITCASLLLQVHFEIIFHSLLFTAGKNLYNPTQNSWKLKGQLESVTTVYSSPRQHHLYQSQRGSRRKLKGEDLFISLYQMPMSLAHKLIYRERGPQSFSPHSKKNKSYYA